MTTKTKNTILLIVVAIIATLIPALIFGKWLEAIIFILAHTLIRPQYPRQYHHIVPAVCRIISACVLFFGVSFILPLEISLVSAVPINYFISWVGKVKADADHYEMVCEMLKAKINDTKSALLIKCRNAGLSERDTQIALMYYYEKKTPKDIWLWLCQQKVYDQVEWNTVYQILWRIGRKLENIEEN